MVNLVNKQKARYRILVTDLSKGQSKTISIGDIGTLETLTDRIVTMLREGSE